MQDFLTGLFDFVVITLAIVAMLNFILGLLKLWTVNTLQRCAQLEPQAPAPAPQPEPVLMTELNTEQMRKQCAANGIKWRNAHGAKHLTKAEMITVLTA